MGRFVCDSSCLVATVCGWHEHHTPTVAEIERRLQQGHELAIASHSLIETYAVLTRLPPPSRLAPSIAMTLLEANWGDAPVICLNAAETWRALQTAEGLGVAGGQTHDALIAACAEKSGASTLLTWNVRHFARFANRLRVIAPR